MAEGAGITRYLNESLRISKALQTFLEARHACEVQYATALAEACYTLKGTVESKVETEGKLQNSLLKQAVMDLIKGTGKIADARYGFAGTMKKNVLDHFSSVILELQTTRDAKIAEIEHLQDPIIESFENYKKAKTLNDAVKETEKEAKDSYSKAQQEQKKKDLEKLSQKATVLAQKVAQTTQAVTDSLLEHDTTRNTYLKETLPNFQKSLVDWAYLRTKTIKYMLLELKSLEQVAVDKALEANNVGKDSAMSIDVQRIVDQFVDTVISKDIEIRKTSATSIRDLKTSTKAGKLYVKRNDSPLSPWSIQYSVLKNNRLYMFENAESEQPKEVILLAKKQEGAHTWNPEKQKKPSASDRVSSDFAIVHPAHRSLFQKDNCFQLLFHANASAASFPLEAPSQETTEVSMESSMFYQEEEDRNIRQSLSMRRGVDSTGERPLDRRYYFMPVDKEASNMWLSAFSQNGAKNCWCGKCLSNQPSKLNLKLWILDGTALGMERGSNDSFGVIVKFGGLKMSRTAFKQGPNPVWNEEFLFEGVTSCTSSIRLAVNSGLNLDNGDSELGTVSFSMSTMALERRTENVHKLVSPSNSVHERTAQPVIKVAYLLTTGQTLPMDSYSELINLLTCPPLEPFHFLSSSLSHDHRDEFFDGYLNLLIALSTPVLPALTCLIDREISTTDDPNILFRGNSVLTKMLERFMRIVGSDYVKATLQESIGNIVQNGWTYEIDPNRIQVTEGADPAEVLEQNWKKLLYQVGVIWAAIDCSVEDCPLALKVIFSRMKASLKKKYAEEKFQQIGISGFIFLRLFCVAILAPRRFGIVTQDPDAPTLRTLTLITKIMQHLANFSQFGAKERHMEYSNEWINSNSSEMKNFINDISSLPIDTALPNCSKIHSLDALSTISNMHRFLSVQVPSLANSPNASSPVCQTLLGAIDKLDTEMEKVSRALLAAHEAAQQKYETNLSKLRPTSGRRPNRPVSAICAPTETVDEPPPPLPTHSSAHDRHDRSSLPRTRTKSHPTISSTCDQPSINQPVTIFVRRPSGEKLRLESPKTSSPVDGTEALPSTPSSPNRVSRESQSNRESLASQEPRPTFRKYSLSAECVVDAQYEASSQPRLAISVKPEQIGIPLPSPATHTPDSETPSTPSAIQSQSPGTAVPRTNNSQGLSGFMNRFKAADSPVAVKTTNSLKEGMEASGEEKAFTFMNLIGGNNKKTLSSPRNARKDDDNGEFQRRSGAAKVSDEEKREAATQNNSRTAL